MMIVRKTKHQELNQLRYNDIDSTLRYCSLTGLPSSEESFKAQTLTISHEGKNTLTSYDRSTNSEEKLQ